MRAHGRIFSVCDGGVMTVTDMKTAKSSPPCRSATGLMPAASIPRPGLIFSSNGESGTLTIVHEDSPDKYTVTGHDRDRVRRPHHGTG